MSEAGTFDPFAMEKPKLRLGALGEWSLVDATDSKIKALDKREKALHALADRVKQPTTMQLAKAVGDLCEEACEDSEGLSALIVSLCDEDACAAAEPKRKPVGQQSLVGISKFVLAWFYHRDPEGNV